MSFFTEKRVEELLDYATRMIAKPDGTLVPVTAFKAFWKAYDFLIFFGDTPERLVKLAILDGELTKRSFSHSLQAVVWNANGHARRFRGIDCFAVWGRP